MEHLGNVYSDGADLHDIEYIGNIYTESMTVSTNKIFQNICVVNFSAFGHCFLMLCVIKSNGSFLQSVTQLFSLFDIPKF